MTKVFLSYRRDDSADVTGRIYDHLECHFGRDKVFRDVDTIPMGNDFRQVLGEAVDRCFVLVAVIGDKWLDIRGAGGTRRLNEAEDYVRIEIEMALRRGIPVLPVLVRGAAMPQPEQLPESIRELAYRNAANVRPDLDFGDDLDNLTTALDRLVTEATAPAAVDRAYEILNERVAVHQREILTVYEGSGSGFKHGFLRVFGERQKVLLDASHMDNPEEGSAVSAGGDGVNHQRSAVLRVTIAPLGPDELIGVSVVPLEKGLDLRGTTHVLLEARSPTVGGLIVQLGVGAGLTNPIHVGARVTPLRISLASLDPTLRTDNVNILFTVVTNGDLCPRGGTLLLDNIRFQQNTPGFPLSTRTAQTVPLVGHEPYPPDQVLRTVAATYDSALTLLALLRRGMAQDRDQAFLVAEAFGYALKHNPQSYSLPTAPDGSRGLRNGYNADSLALLNDDRYGNKKGDVRLATFTSPNSPSGAHVVLDGANAFNNAFAILALTAAHSASGDSGYLEDAKTIGRWIAINLADASGEGFGGYYFGYADGSPQTLMRGKSVADNAAIFAAFSALAVTSKQGAEAAEWSQYADLAGEFVLALFDVEAGRFPSGTVPADIQPGPGIVPTSSVRGDERINGYDCFESNSFAVLALAGAERYQHSIDWRRPVDYLLRLFTRTVRAAGREYRGFSPIGKPEAGQNGIAWESTAQAVVAMRFVDHLAGDSRFEAPAALFQGQIAAAQSAAPFGDGHGLVASTLQDGDCLLPAEQYLHTPFRHVPARVELAATAWAIFAARSWNPLRWESHVG